MGMANELVLSGKGEVASTPKGHALKKAAKKAWKKAAEKHAKKAAKHVGVKGAELKHDAGARRELEAAFHSMQRAAAVVSLMEKGSGEDLRDLLERGVKLYEGALKGDEAQAGQAAGVLRAAEHLALVGLYTGRHKHRERVGGPGRERLQVALGDTRRRLERVADKPRSKGKDMYPVAKKMLKTAEEEKKDEHLAYEVGMAAEALCSALEHGL